MSARSHLLRVGRERNQITARLEFERTRCEPSERAVRRRGAWAAGSCQQGDGVAAAWGGGRANSVGKRESAQRCKDAAACSRAHPPRMGCAATRQGGGLHWVAGLWGAGAGRLDKKVGLGPGPAKEPRCSGLPHVASGPGSCDAHRPLCALGTLMAGGGSNVPRRIPPGHPVYAQAPRAALTMTEAPFWSRPLAPPHASGRAPAPNPMPCIRPPTPTRPPAPGPHDPVPLAVNLPDRSPLERPRVSSHAPAA
jgi:hypothetical protein